VLWSKDEYQQQEWSMQLLGDLGFPADPAAVVSDEDGFVCVHYTHRKHLDSILRPGGGLRAIRKTSLCPDPSRPFIAEALLEVAPRWLTSCPVFGDLGAELFSTHVGNVTLRMSIPLDQAGAWVADAAHSLECKHATRRGSMPMGLGYDCSTGWDAMAGWLRSHVPLAEYRGGHVAPEVVLYAEDDGVIVPSARISRIGAFSA
jgi:hypothetical protein